jgi:hypothetical protein
LSSSTFFTSCRLVLFSSKIQGEAVRCIPWLSHNLAVDSNSVRRHQIDFSDAEVLTVLDRRFSPIFSEKLMLNFNREQVNYPSL